VLILSLSRNEKSLGLLLCVGMLVSVVPLSAQDDYDDYGPQPTGAPQAKAQYEANRAAYKGNPDILVLPGLKADRKARTVEILAEATGVGGDDVAEFLLIDQNSSHGYEAMLWSFAKPSDVHRGLEFIGLEPGTPYNPRAIRLWSDGDRVNVGLREVEGDEVVPIEWLILDTETGETLPEEGFIFAGSMVVQPRDGKGEAQYVADVYDPRSVASIYSEPAAVLDVPRQVSKGEAYGRQVVNPEFAQEAGTLLTIVMTPGDPDGKERGRDLRLSVDTAAGSTGVVYQLVEKGGASLCKVPVLSSVLERIVGEKDSGGVPHLELVFGGGAPLLQVGKTAAVLAMMETMGMVRVNPPSDGQLFYRSFIPDRTWLTPEGRPTQPWELHLVRENGKLVGEMVWHEPIWSADSIEPTFRPRTHAVSTPEALCNELAKDADARQKEKKSALPPVLLVYSNGDMHYADMMRFVGPVLETHGTVYVFVEP
jgi:hypothetical protein